MFSGIGIVVSFLGIFSQRRLQKVEARFRPTYFDSKALLEEEAANMYGVLSKDLAAEILANYTVGKSPRPSMSAFILTDEDFSSTDKVAD